MSAVVGDAVVDMSRHSVSLHDIDEAYEASKDTCHRGRGDRIRDSRAVASAGGFHPYRFLHPTLTGAAAAVWMPMPRAACRRTYEAGSGGVGVCVYC